MVRIDAICYNKICPYPGTQEKQRQAHACHNQVGQKFIEEETTPEGMCLGAWNAITPYINALLFGGNFPWENEECYTFFAVPIPKV